MPEFANSLPASSSGSFDALAAQLPEERESFCTRFCWTAGPEVGRGPTWKGHVFVGFSRPLFGVARLQAIFGGFQGAVMDPATARAEVFVNGNGESSCTEPWQPGRLLGGLKVRIPWLRSSQQSKDDVK